MSNKRRKDHIPADTIVPESSPAAGPRPTDLTSATGAIFKAAAGQPQILMRQWTAFAADVGQIVGAEPAVAGDPKSRRRADPGRTTHELHDSLVRAYVAWSQAAIEFVAKTDLPSWDATRARLLASIFTDTLAPANNPLLNPATVRRFVETGGKRAVAGLRNYLDDMSKNGGLPSSVDPARLKVGETLAATPGTVVFRSEVLELIQYTPTTDQVQRRPLVIVPPLINRYYSVDMCPDRSVIRFLLANGIQPYCVSWRNPTAAHADWGLDTYVFALDAAVDAARDIAGCETVNAMASCSGGLLLSAYAAFLAGRDRAKLESVSLVVSMLDPAAEGEGDHMPTPDAVAAAKQMAAARGTIDGQELAKTVPWMRPNDRVWTYWADAYLQGDQPPAFDVLAWNADTTRLPARLHGDLLDLIVTHSFAQPGTMSIAGTPIDMTRVKTDAYVVAGSTDEVTPWRAVYRTARVYGGRTRFVLSESGHLQSLLMPPGDPKAAFATGVAEAADGEAWLSGAARGNGSWWLDWADFLKARSGETIAAPGGAGNARFAPFGPAPGTYVLEP